MKTKINLIQSITVVLILFLLIGCNADDRSSSDRIARLEREKEDGPQKDNKLSDGLRNSIDFLSELTFKNPINYKNLQIFMISGTTTADNINYVSLKLAMEKKWVEVLETSDVNELKITNHSNKTIFINAGDIVKGGKQDRTLTYDMVIAPKAKEEKLSSFCVESGRWSKRGQEDVAGFESNNKMLTSRKLKIASKKYNNQSRVWSEVAEQQEKLNYNISQHYSTNVDVKANESASSLELTLDNKELKRMKESYKAHFSNLLEEQNIGLAYAINGELYTLDIYNNKQLFVDLFEKLMDACIVEAITDLDSQQKKYNYLSVQDLKNLLTIDATAKENAKDLNARTRWISKEDKEKIIFTSLDKENNLKWIHRNIIVKDDTNTSIIPNHQIQNDNVEEATEEVMDEY